MSSKFLSKVRNVVIRIVFQVFLIIVLLEVILRIYNPIQGSVQGDKILLHANQTLEVRNDQVFPDMPAKWTVSTNSLGFRGTEPPKNWNKSFKVITVGGSTTFCVAVDDSLTWSYRLERTLKEVFPEIWINNAGLQGHSTHGHKILLEDHVLRLKPDIILFLIGVNDTWMLPEFGIGTVQKKIKFWLYKSELVKTFIGVIRVYKGKKFHAITESGATYNITKLDKNIIPEDEATRLLDQYSVDLEAYATRLTDLINICRNSDVVPIIMTQPLLFGKTSDPTTNIDLYTIDLPYSEMNSGLFSEVLDDINERTRLVCNATNTSLIDLAVMLPKDSKYYLDGMHYTPLGNQKIVDLIYPELKQYMLEIKKSKFN